MLAFPAPWKHRLVGIGLGFHRDPGAQSRAHHQPVSTSARWNRVWFDWFHLYLWQALIVLDALVFWLIWLR